MKREVPIISLALITTLPTLLIVVEEEEVVTIATLDHSSLHVVVALAK